MERRKPKSPLKSKTNWLGLATIVVGAVEQTAPGVIQPGPFMMLIGVASIVLRSITTTPIAFRPK